MRTMILLIVFIGPFPMWLQAVGSLWYAAACIWWWFGTSGLQR